MVAHNEVNGLPLHGNKFILTEVIRNWFGSGSGSNNTGDALLIASDWGNVEQISSYGVAADQEHAAALAAWSGLDNTMSPPPQAFSTLVDAVTKGIISESFIDRAAANNLKEKFATGLFDGAAVINETAYNTGIDLPADRELAYESAAAGIVPAMRTRRQPLRSAPSSKPAAAAAAAADTSPAIFATFEPPAPHSWCASWLGWRSRCSWRAGWCSGILRNKRHKQQPI